MQQRDVNSGWTLLRRNLVLDTITMMNELMSRRRKTINGKRTEG